LYTSIKVLQNKMNEMDLELATNSTNASNDTATTAGDGDILGQIDFRTEDASMPTTGGFRIGCQIQGLSSSGYGDRADIVFRTAHDSTSLTERMRIKSDGIVYISSGYLKMGGLIRSDADNTDDLGTTGDRWRDVWCNAGAFNSSDINLKRDVETSALGLDFIDKLNPVSYKWKDVPEVLWKEDDEDFKLMEAKVGDVRVPAQTHKRTHYGLIAQEVVITLDELGIDTADFAAYSDGTASLDRHGNKIGEDGPCALRYTEFIAPMMKAIQELSAKVTALENA